MPYLFCFVFHLLDLQKIQIKKHEEELGKSIEQDGFYSKRKLDSQISLESFSNTILYKIDLVIDEKVQFSAAIQSISEYAKQHIIK